MVLNSFFLFFFFFKQKTAYEMRISDWSSDVCSSDLKRAASHWEDATLNAGHGRWVLTLILLLYYFAGASDIAAGRRPRRRKRTGHRIVFQPVTGKQIGRAPGRGRGWSYGVN